VRPLSALRRNAKPRTPARLRFAWAAAGLVSLALAAVPQAALAAARPALGANISLVLPGHADCSGPLDSLVEAGVTSIRTELDWNQVEPRPGEFMWAPFDQAIDAARERDLDIVLVLGPCAEWAVDPAWRVPPQELSRSVPKSTDVWRRYVREAVTHFRGRVGAWQVREQPNARNFRGARREYAALLRAAAEEIRAADPAARIIVPEAGHLDLAAMDAFMASGGCEYADVLGVYLPDDSCRLPLPWAVLAEEVLGRCPQEQRRPLWVLGGEAGESAARQWHVHYLMAWAFGAERCYLPLEAIDAAWTTVLAGLEYKGFTSPAAGAIALVFERLEGRSLAVAWGAEDMAIPTAAPRTDGGGPSRRDDLPAAAAPASSDQTPVPTPVQIGPCPSVVAHIELADPIREGAPGRADVLGLRAGIDLKDVPLVYADYSMPALPEFGLENRRLRLLRGGKALEENRSGRTCIRTQLSYQRGREERGNPWLYFDVDDGWLYFNRGQEKIAITVECEAASAGARKVGFNILYESTRGYRFTPWQWVDPGYGWRRYRFEIGDASFTNCDGYDFRVNAKGSKQDLYVCAVTVEKLARPVESGTEGDRAAGAQAGSSGTAETPAMR
jgi:hypothetical protein